MTQYIKQGALRGEKLQNPDGGTSYCVWYPFEQEGEQEGIGLCFDFEDKDLNDLIELIKRLDDTEPIKLAKKDE